MSSVLPSYPTESTNELVLAIEDVATQSQIIAREFESLLVKISVAEKLSDLYEQLDACKSVCLSCSAPFAVPFGSGN